MRVIGLTGGIASGKSTVLNVLKKLGFIVIEVDKTAHLIMEPGQKAYQEIVELFGSCILGPDGKIDRLLLGNIVFNDPALLTKLNQITHPRVGQFLQRRLREIEDEQPHAVVVLEVPLLFESGMDKLCDHIFVVWVDRETQIRRLMLREGLEREQARKRIMSQMDLNEKAKLADFVIDNTQSIEITAEIAEKYFSVFSRHF
ncbi:MAG: dephospho-CoA kinase [Syntrophomonadaceae bacterium]|jgi:dephospho-CoA kinase|nr:dephospho-CoA kinase [Syntrophomonadaceae bacterium]